MWNTVFRLSGVFPSANYTCRFGDRGQKSVKLQALKSVQSLIPRTVNSSPLIWGKRGNVFLKICLILVYFSQESRAAQWKRNRNKVTKATTSPRPTSSISISTGRLSDSRNWERRKQSSRRYSEWMFWLGSSINSPENSIRSTMNWKTRHRFDCCLKKLFAIWFLK